MNRSVATLSSPEFINITSISPMISKCDVKVLYIGQNRNRSAISKEVAESMAQTLPGCPIVGYFIDRKEDFGDHGDQMVIDGEGVHFNTLTKPYGFVPIEAKVWFQDFEDTDDFGNVVVRKYLMTEGYLWTGQFEECKRVMESGNPQSMELDEKTLKGHWSEDVNKGCEFFIINDATITKLCILGEDVEPCFEGASVTAPKVSSTFTKLDGKDDFSATLFTMLKQLRELKNNKGGYSMDGIETTPVVEESVVSTEFEAEEVKTTFDDGGDAGSEATGDGATSGEESTDAPAEGSDTPADGTTEGATDSTDADTELPETEIINGEEVSKEAVDEACINVPKKSEFACEGKDEDEKKKFEKKEDEDKKEADEESANSEDKDDESESDENDNNKEDDDKKKYAMLEQEYAELKEKFSLLETETAELRKFKVQIEDAKKDELIASFYMLSDEDKKDVIENKTNYSLDDIEAKLSIICFRKKVNFNLDEEAAPVATEEVPTTFDINAHEAEMLPAWLAAVKSNRDK